MDYTKLTLRICGWSSIWMGMVFLVYPEWYIELEGATTDNMAWLRNLGAALVAVNGVGALLAARDHNRRGHSMMSLCWPQCWRQ